MKDPGKIIKAADGSRAKAWEFGEVDGKVANESQAEKNQRRQQEQLELLKRVSAAELQKLRDEAYREGFEEGRAEGIKAGEAEVARRAELWEKRVDALARPLEQERDQVEQELLQLAILIAKQVIRREVKQSPDQIIAVVREALSLLPSQAKEIRIRVHPDDAMQIRSIYPESDSRTWILVEDPSMDRGSCLVETDRSVVDARLEVRLAEIAASLLGGERSDD
jgi:flagellar assembly protein FliH